MTDATPASRPEPPTWGPAFVKGVVVVVGLLAALVIVAMVVGGGGSDDDSADGAEVACEDFVKDRLKSPGTAEFSETFTTSQADGSWEVEGAVDSENAFGGTMRNTYTCTVRYDEAADYWSLVDMESTKN